MLIEQETRDGWRGVIRLQTQGGQATALLAQLAERLMNEQSHWGILSHESPGAPQLHRLELDASKAASAESTPPKLEFIQEPVSQPEYCVSYAWGDLTEEGKEREAIVDRLCDAAEKRGIRILRDKNTVGLGEGISKFMGRIGQADRVFVVLSDKYLKSPYCMTEFVRDLAQQPAKRRPIFGANTGLHFALHQDLFSIGPCSMRRILEETAGGAKNPHG